MVIKAKSIKQLPDNSVFDEMISSIGELTIVASSKGLHAILWDNYREKPQYRKAINNITQCKTDKIILETKKQLKEYFEGKRKVFDLPLVLNGTDFQIKAWKQLCKIPYAKTMSYGAQAEKIGDKNKARAVGMANGSNPLSIIIPCHRVIGSNGKLVGFGGGLDKKEYLLAFEKANM